MGYLRINQPPLFKNDHFQKIVTIFRRKVKNYQNIWVITKMAVISQNDRYFYQNDLYS